MPEKSVPGIGNLNRSIGEDIIQDHGWLCRL